MSEYDQAFLDAVLERDALRSRVAELEGALRDLCDEVDAAHLAAVKARRLKQEVKP